MAKSPRETAFDDDLVPAAKKVNRYIDRPLKNIAALTAAVAVRRGGQEISWLQETADAKTLGQQNQEALAKIDAKVSGLVGAIAAINKGEPFDQAKLLASIEEAAERGVTASIASVTRQEVTVVEMKEEEA